MPSDPYAAGLAMLARCELSTAEVVERLRRRGFAPGDIEGAVERLREEHALDDHRTATVHARRSARIRRRGPLRAEREIAALGISPAVAGAAVAEVYAEEGAQTVLERALARRLAEGAPVESRAQFARLYRYLVRQGFDPPAVSATLRARAATHAPPDPDETAS